MRSFKFNDITIASYGSYVLKSADGLESGKPRRKETVYVDTDGSTFEDIFFEPRIPTISGWIMADSEYEMNRLKRNLIKNCNPKNETVLYYNNGTQKYYANVFPDELPQFGARVKWVLPFILYFNIYNFYWQSSNEIIQNIYKRADLVGNQFTLPAMFTSRTNKATIVNDGDEETFGIYTIICNQPIESLKLSNNTTGKFVQFNYDMQIGETVTIDNEKHKITSSINGDIINNVSSDTSFFGLVCGSNEIECIATGVTVVLNYRNKYLGV